MIDSNLQAELRRKYNPEGSLLRRHQLRMLEILKYVDKVCRENNIPYWLSFGTCLGAVRHGGFIPWDDDVDIEMLGKDFDRFVKIMETASDCPYAIQTHKTDSAYIYQFAKVRDEHSALKENTCIDRDYKFHGIFIDIFPMDYSPYKFFTTVGRFLCWACLVVNKINCRIFRKTCRSIIYFLAFQLTAPLVRFISHFKKTDYLHHRFGSLFYTGRVITDIFPLATIIFEGYEFFAPRDMDIYLKTIYGDYMKIPQEKESHIVFPA